MLIFRSSFVIYTGKQMIFNFLIQFSIASFLICCGSQKSDFKSKQIVYSGETKKVTAVSKPSQNNKKPSIHPEMHPAVPEPPSSNTEQVQNLLRPGLYVGRTNNNAQINIEVRSFRQIRIGLSYRVYQKVDLSCSADGNLINARGMSAIYRTMPHPGSPAECLSQNCELHLDIQDSSRIHAKISCPSSGRNEASLIYCGDGVSTLCL